MLIYLLEFSMGDRMKAVAWPVWLEVWNAQKRGEVAPGCDLRELLRQDREALALMPELAAWPKSQRGCDNQGEVNE